MAMKELEERRWKTTQQNINNTCQNIGGTIFKKSIELTIKLINFKNYN